MEKEFRMVFRNAIGHLILGQNHPSRRFAGLRTEGGQHVETNVGEENGACVVMKFTQDNRKRIPFTAIRNKQLG